MNKRKVILIDWNAYGNREIAEVFASRGYSVQKCRFGPHLDAAARDQALRDLSDSLLAFKPDYVFSFHYFPDISDVCRQAEVTYLSWIYDSPAFDLYSPTVLNECNRIFVFDRGIVADFEAAGINTVYYLPLGIPSAKNGSKQKDGRKFNCDITFVGSLYSEPKHRLYDRFKDIPPYAHGYLDACIQAQKHLYGVNILESLITPEIEREMQRAYPTDPNSANVMSPAKLYSQFVLSRQVTSIERYEILQILGQHSFDTRLYTHDRTVSIPGIKNMGPVEYGAPMYDVFAGSRINLNITLRSILTGIPLRALDILSAGGFLMSNYQAELCEYFTPGSDFEYYSDHDDLCAKIEYYLSHERERADIAASGQEKVLRDHTFDKRLDLMEELI